MAKFGDIIKIAGMKEDSKPSKPRHVVSKTVRKSKGRGCEFCPLNTVKGIHKIIGKVRGRKIFVWAQSPGPEENREGKELIGRSGKWFWDEMEGAGLTRDMVDIQNVVRCYPADRIVDKYGPMLKMRNPSKEEIFSCNAWTDKALEKSKARVHVVLGQVAAKALLGTEYKKDRTVFWSEKLKGWAICADHPSFFIRGGSRARLRKFRELLKHAAKLAKVSSGSRFGYIEKQHYVGIATVKEAKRAYRKIVRAPGRVSADFEWGYVDEHGKATADGRGRRTALVYGFCPRPGYSYVFYAGHPDAPIPNQRAGKKIIKIVKKILTDEKIKKLFHHGCSDVEATSDLLHCDIRGYDYDTEFGEYFRFPDAHGFGLDIITSRRMPQFAGYKQIVVPDALTTQFFESYVKPHKNETKDEAKHRYLTKTPIADIYQKARKNGGLNYALVPWKKMVLYNGADNDVQKRIELTTKQFVNLELMHVYIDASFILAKMEVDGPLFDYKHHRDLEKWWPVQAQYHLRMIRKYAKKILGKEQGKTFNPNSPPQVWNILYNKLRLQKVLPENLDRDGNPVKPDTGKNTLDLLGEYHPLPKHIKEFRYYSKGKGTYLDGFKISADMFGGKLRTRWWLTGTGTGRMSSGGGKNKKDEDITGIVNLQNVHGNHQIQCLLISDKQWRKLYKYWLKHGPFKSDKDIPFWVWKLRVLLGFDHAQMELRVLAQKSKDKALIRIFSTKQDLNTKKTSKCTTCKKKEYLCKNCRNCTKDCGCGDPHSLVGHELTGWEIYKIKIDDAIRRVVKNMQFGIVFGLNENNLFDYMVAKKVYRYARNAKEKKEELKNRERVKEFHRKYFERFSAVRQMIEEDRAFAEKNGYVQTLFGFKRTIGANAESDRDAYWGNQAVNCVDYDTEALTQRGWVSGSSLQKGDVLLTFNTKNKALEWQSAIDIKKFPDYKGPIVEFQSKAFSSVTTPDHRWPVRHKQQYVCKLSKDMGGWGQDAIPRTGSYQAPANNDLSLNWLELVGWVLTDGHYGQGQGYAGNSVSVCQVKKHNVKEIDALFKRLNIPYRRRKKPLGDEVFWHFSGLNGGWFKATFPHRVLTPEFLTRLSKYQLKVLYKTMLKGDGSIGDKTGFYCRSKAGAEAFQMLAMLCGKSSHLFYRDMSKYKPKSRKLKSIPRMKGIWCVTVHERDHVQVTSKQKKTYKSKKCSVWCPMVPNTYFVARRGGQTFITGNTPIQGTAHQVMLMGLVPLKRKPLTYKLLQKPKMEVHDAIYFSVKLRNMWKAATKGEYMLEKESIKIVRKKFGIDWKVPLKAEPKAGFRFGCMVKADKDHIKGENKTAQFLNNWCTENQKMMKELSEQLAKAEDAYEGTIA